MMIAIDVHYREDFAKAISVEFMDWEQDLPDKINETHINEVEEYVSGEFYRRELPCILKILEKSPLEQVKLIIVDSYVTLNNEGKKGLGMYLYEELDGRIPIVGVAKKEFLSITKNVRKVYRGKSKNPLFVTAVGIDLDEASQRVENMAGAYRMPDLLRILDQKTKA